MSEETPIMRNAMLALSKWGARVFRNNVGLAVFVDRRGVERRVKYGLCTGSSDIIGFVPVVITPDMVGQTVAVFLAVETKDEAATTEGQGNFIAMVRRFGGRAGIAKSDEDAIAVAAGEAPGQRRLAI